MPHSYYSKKPGCVDFVEEGCDHQVCGCIANSSLVLSAIVAWILSVSKTVTCNIRVPHQYTALGHEGTQKFGCPLAHIVCMLLGIGLKLYIATGYQ